ncbi:MAG TPA: TonB-dependent receptor, partial [Chitinophagaceae bacterium]|nr:TonB-dependent receptor [Chitinophagaceae bacterium]
EANNNFGSFQTFRNTLKGGTGLMSKHFTVDARLSNIRSNGYIDRAKSNLQSFYFSTAYLSDKTTLRFNAFTGKEKTYQAWYGVSGSDLKENRRVNYAGMERPDVPYDNETDNYTQQNYQAFFTHKISSKLVFNTGLFYVKGRGYYEQYKSDEEYEDYNLIKPIYGRDTIFKTDLVRQLWLDNDFYGDVFSLHYTSGKTGLTLGGMLSNYKGKHFGEVIWAKNGLGSNGRWYDVAGKKKDLNVYTKWQQEVSPTLLTYVDLQYRKVDYTIDGFRYNPTLLIDKKYSFFNPKVGVTYHKNNFLAFASYSIANKEPNRDDFEAGTNEQPKSEKLNDVEIGLEQKSNDYNWSATLYYMKYKDQLVLTGKINDVGAYTRTNVSNSYRAGVELTASANVLSWLSAAANMAVSSNRIKGFTEYIDDYDNGGQKTNNYAEGDLSFSPSVVGGATITVTPIKNVEVGFISKYVSQQYLDNTTNKDRMLDAYFTEDIRALYSFKFKALKNVILSAQLNNVFNHFYEPNGYTFSYYSNNRLETENYYFPMAGVNWVVGLSIKL